MQTPNYYSVTPAVVRYHPTLCANAKLLFGELTALANREGYAYPSNEYLANLYRVEERQIRRWLAQLREAGFIQMIEFEGERRIYIDAIHTIDLSTLGEAFAVKKDRGGRSKKTGQAVKKDLHNNTVNNSIPTTEVVGSATPFLLGLWVRLVKSKTGAEPPNKSAEGKALKTLLNALKDVTLPDVDRPINEVFGSVIEKAETEKLKSDADLLQHAKRFATFVAINTDNWITSKYRLTLYLQNLNGILGSINQTGTGASKPGARHTGNVEQPDHWQQRLSERLGGDKPLSAR